MTTSKRRLLLLSYAFPPATAPEAMLSAKRAGNVPGWPADVICAAPFHPGMGNDQDMAAYAESRFGRVVRLSPAVRLPLHRLGVLAHLPDPMRLLNGQALRRATALHREAPFDAVLTWSTYYSVHLVGLALQRRLGLPWLAHMSDPWVDNPFVSYGGIAGAVNRRLERMVIERADRVLMTTPETVDLVMAKYPPGWRERVVVIPHGYEPQLYSGARPAAVHGRRLVLRYLGNFYGIRTPEPLFAALKIALELEPRAFADVVVEIFGKLDAGMDRTPLARSLPEGFVRVMPSVGYRQSLELMETADLLLIVDAPARLSVFLPSKLVDYLGAGRPIVSLTPPGASRRVTEEAGFWAASPDDPEAAARALLDALAAIRAGQAAARCDESYSVAATGRRLAEVLENVMGSRLASGG
jgi:glycosyltransferase involved in cell wall biosynthesis